MIEEEVNMSVPGGPSSFTSFIYHERSFFEYTIELTIKYSVQYSVKYSQCFSPFILHIIIDLEEGLGLPGSQNII